MKVAMIPSAASFASDLNDVERALESRVNEASEAAARRSSIAMRRLYNARHSSRSGRASSSFSSAGPILAFGGSSIPYMLGQNFGSARYRQFPRQTSPDHFAFSAVRAETKSIVELFGRASDDAMNKAF